MTASANWSGIAAILALDNVDTDVIMPMAPLMKYPKSELGPHVFQPLRYQNNGEENPDFVLNRPGYRRASILVSGENFGCGSSREAAVHGLKAFGISAIIAPSFADIFRRNCVNNNIIPAVLNRQDYVDLLKHLSASARPQKLTLNLESQTLAGEQTAKYNFLLSPADKELLLSEKGDLQRALDCLPGVQAFQERDKKQRPWAWQPIGIQDT